MKTKLDFMVNEVSFDLDWFTYDHMHKDELDIDICAFNTYMQLHRFLHKGEDGKEYFCYAPKHLTSHLSLNPPFEELINLERNGLVKHRDNINILNIHCYYDHFLIAEKVKKAGKHKLDKDVLKRSSEYKWWHNPLGQFIYCMVNLFKGKSLNEISLRTGISLDEYEEYMSYFAQDNKLV
jgi:hypothetical protein